MGEARCGWAECCYGSTLFSIRSFRDRSTARFWSSSWNLGGKRIEVTKPHQASHDSYETAFASDRSHIAKHARAHYHHHYYHDIALTPPKSNTFLDQVVLATDFGARSPPIFFSPDPECIQERMRRCRVNGLIATHVNDSTPKQIRTTRTHHTTPPLTRTHARTCVQFLDQRIALTAWA